MAQRLICPECRSKLYLRTPAVAATKVKCRDCGHKFYVGHSLEDKPVPMSAAVVPSGAAAILEPSVEATPDLDTDDDSHEQPALVAEPRKPERKRERRKLQEEPGKLPAWVIPVGVVSLIAAIVLALFFSTKP